MKQKGTCQCEHLSHGERSCIGKGVIFTKTVYGPVIVCAECNTEHPIPASHRK